VVMGRVSLVEQGRVSLVEQGRRTLLEHMSSPIVPTGGLCCSVYGVVRFLLTCIVCPISSSNCCPFSFGYCLSVLIRVQAVVLFLLAIVFLS
jgi:hypothetical protein